MSTLNYKTEHQDLDLVDADLLPPQIRQLVQLIGLPDTIKLLQTRGGTFLRIPHNAKDSKLAKLIGLASASILCDAFRGEQKELPKADKILIQLRNHAIRKARLTMSASQVALKFRLTRRHVINLTGDDDQGDDLFSMSS